ncbi:unnamed protein product, partial [Candidula unifasciata]
MDIFQSICDDSPIWDTERLTNNSWPEFTQCFQWTVLSWLPDFWLWICLPTYVWYVRKRSSLAVYRLSGSKLNITKIFLCLLQAVLTLLQLFSAVQQDDNIIAPAKAFYLSCSISAVTYIVAAFLTRNARKAGIASPCILFMFWLLNLICHIPPLYSYVLSGAYKEEQFQFDIQCASFVFIVIQFFLHFIAEKVNLGYENTSRKPSPEISASFPSKITFHWMTSYIWQGYRKSLSPEDIWELPEYYKSQNIVPEFEKEWGKEVAKATEKNRNLSPTFANHVDEGTHLLSDSSESLSSMKGKHQPSLFKVLMKTFAPELLIAHSMRLVADAIQFFLPILTNLLINFVETRNEHRPWHGYALAACFFVVTFVYSVLFNQNSFRGSSIGMKIKTALVAAVYKKSLTMNPQTKRVFTMGNIVNLMAIDCQVLQDVTSNLYIVISAPFQICVAFYFLNDTLGVSFVAGVAVIVALIPLNARISVLAKRAQAEQLRVKDERLKIMNEILSGIKVLKLYAWEESFEDRILELRGRELKLMRSAAILNIINVFSWLCSPVLVTTTTFITYIFVSHHGSLDSKTAFVSLILFNILSIPMNRLPNLITDLVSAHVSIGRLNKFLSGEDLDPNNVIREKRPEKTNAISITSGTFLWDRSMPPTLK